MYEGLNMYKPICIRSEISMYIFIHVTLIYKLIKQKAMSSTITTVHFHVYNFIVTDGF